MKINWNVLFKGALVAALIISLISGYYIYGIYYPSTNDAYVGANLLDVSANADGFVEHIYVENNQFVKKGQLLLEINPKNYIVNINKAENNKIYAETQLNVQKAAIQVAATNLSKAEHEYVLAQQQYKRYKNLFISGSGSEQDMQIYEYKLQVAEEQIKQSQALYLQSKDGYEVNKANVAIVNNDVQNATINAAYTKVFAPVDGYVSNLNLVTGQLVKNGQPIFGLIDNNSWWIDANFKETQLERIRIGQSVDVKLDMYTNRYHGVVKSISYASGNTFALLPAQNATGNWVKVTQRFTVRVQIKNDNHNYPLRVGASCDVMVNTKAGE